MNYEHLRSVHPPAEYARARLRRRVAYFFRASARRRSEVASFAAQLAKFGDVAVVGGMLRNLNLEGNRDFVSDVDFVVDADNLFEFDEFIENTGCLYKKNRFGGYSLVLERWRVDVWPLKRTWASTEGYVEVRTLSDCVKTTFFNWDSIVLLMKGMKIVSAPSYFDFVNARFLDINLAANPNPLGNAVRALRYASLWDARFSYRLASHVLEQVTESGWEKLLAVERVSFASRIVAGMSEEAVMSRLKAAVKDGSETGEVNLRLRQKEFRFSE